MCDHGGPRAANDIGVYWGKGGQITKLQIEDLYLNNTLYLNNKVSLLELCP